jgi:type IV pilus assembly protein PilW
LQENGRSVLQLLTDTIQHGGYSATSVAPFEDIFIRGAVTTSSCTDSNDSVSNPALFSAMGNNTTTYGDTLGIVYMGDDNLDRDCLGGLLPATCHLGSGAPRDAAKIYNQFFVADNAEGVPTLSCSGSRTATAQQIAEGVENIQFTYGEDINSDGVADRYVNSAEVSNWEEVVGVNIAVLVRSLRPVASANISRSYQLSEDTIISKTDRYLRAVFTATVRIRNVIL